MLQTQRPPDPAAAGGPVSVDRELLFAEHPHPVPRIITRSPTGHGVFEEDLEGIDLASPEQACEEATLPAREIVAERIRMGHLRRRRRVRDHDRRRHVGRDGSLQVGGSTELAASAQVAQAHDVKTALNVKPPKDKDSKSH
ncbi:DUF6894 family protein [Rhizobium ruizarguesonis]|uniref:DUF6894 family protein n=1 Tax=Rhizobium ruizarguesonis TaxID=2081791 RepID=UPI0038579FF0